MKYNIRQAGYDDIDIIIPLMNNYRIFYKQESSIEKVRDFLHDRFNFGQCVVFLAFDDSEAIGFTLLYPLFSTVSLKRNYLLNDLFVSSKFRKKGIGDMLLNKAKDYAKSTGASGLMLQTAVDNFTAQSLYEKNGWAREEEFYLYKIKY